MTGRRVGKETKERAVAFAARVYGVSPVVVLWPCRSRLSSYPRQLAMWALRQRRDPEGEPYHSYPMIGEAFGMDHTTAIHSVRQVDKRLKEGKLKLPRIHRAKIVCGPLPVNNKVSAVGAPKQRNIAA